MNTVFDSFWRALAYCFRPGVIALSILPIVLMASLSLGFGYFYWNAALEGVRRVLDASTVINGMLTWLASMGAGSLKAVLAPLILILAVVPLITVVAMLIAAWLMAPALTALVAKRRFPNLERKLGASLVSSVAWSLMSAVLALVALMVSMPFWLVPPLILVFPPLIWGWLTYRVMAFDALAEFASVQERRELFRRHRSHLLAIGLFCGYLGSVPSLIWASGSFIAAASVFLLPFAVWLYTLVFALSSLWFAHYCLSALQSLRDGRVDVAARFASENYSSKQADALPLPHEPNPPLPTVH